MYKLINFLVGKLHLNEPLQSKVYLLKIKMICDLGVVCHYITINCKQANTSRDWEYLTRLAFVSADKPTQVLPIKNIKNV